MYELGDRVRWVYQNEAFGVEGSVVDVLVRPEADHLITFWVKWDEPKYGPNCYSFPEPYIEAAEPLEIPL